MSLALPPSARRALERLDAPRDAATWREAADRFAAGVRSAFLAPVELYLFGSRVRGDDHADSDVDIAVVFPDPSAQPWQRLRTLSGIAYDVLVDTGVRVEPHPFSASEWIGGEPGGFAERIRGHARRLP